MDNGPLNNTTDQSQQQPNNQRGTGFTNLQQYLQANQNNNLDPYIGGQLQNETSNLQNQVSQNQDQFQSDLSQGQQQIQNNQNEVNSVLSNPTSANSQQVQDFSNFRTPQQYSGPTGLNSYNDLYNQAQNLSGLGSQLQGGNVQDLLGRYFSGNQYTTGDQNFDSMLLGSAPNIKQGINSLNQVSPNQINALNAGDIGQAQGLQGKQNAFTQGVQQQLGLTPQGTYDQNSTTGALQKFINPINNEVLNYQKLQNQDMPQLQNQLQFGGDLSKVDPQALQALGLSKLQGGNSNAMLNLPGFNSNPNSFYTYGVNPNSYYTAPPSAINANSVVTPQQAAQYAALVNLSGVQPNLLTLAGNAPSLDATGKPEGGYSANPNANYGSVNAKNIYGQFNVGGFQNAVNDAANQQTPGGQTKLADLLNKYANDSRLANSGATPAPGDNYQQQAQADLNQLNQMNPNWNQTLSLPKLTAMDPGSLSPTTFNVQQQLPNQPGQIVGTQPSGLSIQNNLAPNYSNL